MSCGATRARAAIARGTTVRQCPRQRVVVLSVVLIAFLTALPSSHADGHHLAPLLGRPRGVARLFAGPSPDPAAAAAEHIGSTDPAATTPVIVLFTGDGDGGAAAAAAAAEEVRRLNDDAGVPAFVGRIQHTFAAVPGLSGEVSAAALDFLRALPDTSFAEFDDIIVADSLPPEQTQSVGQFWNLDRSDQEYLPYDAQFTYRHSGAGVEVYVVDSGMRTTHTEFEGRGIHSKSIVGDDADCHGHGTHVAGIVGGRLSGVAKGATMYAVKVLDCEGAGSVSNVLAGLDHTIQEIVAKSPRRPTVINLSLGAPASSGGSIVEFAESAVDQGITVIAAAGNEAALACNLAPALSPKVISVASSSTGDVFSTSFSNHGSCVDVIAPGDRIVSSSKISDTAHELRSGTSMAAPFVAGLAAQYLSVHPTHSPQQVRDALMCAALPDMLRYVPANTPNLLAVSMARYLDDGACRSATCTTDVDCSLNGVCSGGACVCDAGYVGFNCGKPVPVTYLPARSGSIDGSTSTSDDWWDDETEETMYSITVPAGGRLQLVLCSAQTDFDARLALLSSPPSKLYDTAAPLRESADPILLNCDLSESTNTAPIDVWGLSGGSYYVVVTSKEASFGVTDGDFRLNWWVSDPGNECAVNAWTAWTACSASCGTGTQTRTRSVATPGSSCPELQEERVCTMPECSCVVSDWSAWSACDASCGDGQQTRTRTKVSGDDVACPVLTETQTCATGVACECQVTQWGSWGACNSACGAGTRTRTRSVADAGVSSDCPALEQSEPCDAGSCTCVVSEWGPWDACDAACGYGSHTRTRTHVSGPANACPELSMTEECQVEACPGGCQVGAWNGWTGCTAQCGGGTRFRTRAITTVGTNGGSDCPATRQEETCNQVACTNCVVSTWSAWGTCGGSCGIGTTLRTRSVVTVPTNGDICPLLSDTKACVPSSCFLVVVVMRFEGASLSLTSAVSAAVAAAIVESTASAQPQLTSEHITVELAPVTPAGSAPTPGVLSVQATVPVDTVELGRAVASAAQTGVSGGAVATKVSQSAGVVVTAQVQTAELATQDGQLVENVYVTPQPGNGGSDANADITDTQLIVMLAAALGGLLILCLGVALIACYFGDRKSRPGHRSAAVTPASRRVDLRHATRVVSVGPSRHNVLAADDAWSGDRVSDDGNPAAPRDAVAPAPVQRRGGAVRAARVVPSGGGGAYASGEGDGASPEEHSHKHKHKHKHKRKHKHKHKHRHHHGEGDDGSSHHGSSHMSIDGSRELLELEGSVTGRGRLAAGSSSSLRQPPHVHPARQGRSSSRRLQEEQPSRSARFEDDDDSEGQPVVLSADVGREHVRNSQRMQRMM